MVDVRGGRADDADVDAATDPVLLHAVRNNLGATVREVAVTVTRTAYSALISGTSGSVGDTDAAILTASGELIATDEASIIHMASLPTGIRYVLAAFPLETVRDGDIFINNDPHRGAIHSNDTMVFEPVFVDGELEYWVAVMAHITDVGGMTPGGMSVGATSVFAEGLVIPPLKLYDAGVENTSLLNMVAANSRQPEETVGDVLALVAGAHVGAARVRELVAHHGAARVRTIVRELLAYTERRCRRAISELPDGVYSAESLIDDDGLELDRDYRVCATVAIDGDAMTVDFAGTSAQARGSINSSYSQSVTAATYALRCYLRGVPLNDGFWRPIEMRLPPGTLVNPDHPAACNTRMANTAPAVMESVLWALSSVAPADVGSVAGAGIPEVHAINPRERGEYWLHFECEWGGGGARDTVDGVDAGGTSMIGGGGGTIAIEMVEANYDLRCEHVELQTDSGGPGRFRGGLGLEKQFRFLCDCILSARTDRFRCPPAGLAGGGPGAPGAYVLNPGTDRARDLPSKFADLEVTAGDVISLRTCGGGGYGPPEARDPDDVLADVARGGVSLQRALDDYGVVIVASSDGTELSVDAGATAKARAAAT